MCRAKAREHYEVKAPRLRTRVGLQPRSSLPRGPESDELLPASRGTETSPRRRRMPAHGKCSVKAVDEAPSGKFDGSHQPRSWRTKSPPEMTPVRKPAITGNALVTISSVAAALDRYLVSAGRLSKSRPFVGDYNQPPSNILATLADKLRYQPPS